MELEVAEPPAVPSPVCARTLRVHAFAALDDEGREARCRECGLVMPTAAIMRDGPGARHCIACGWWSPEDDCARGGAWCVWCKTPFED